MVYNNYPWPTAVTDKQRASVEAAALAVLDARAQYPTSTLADLYDPLATGMNMTGVCLTGGGGTNITVAGSAVPAPPAAPAPPQNFHIAARW